MTPKTSFVLLSRQPASARRLRHGWRQPPLPYSTSGAGARTSVVCSRARPPSPAPGRGRAGAGRARRSWRRRLARPTWTRAWTSCWRRVRARARARPYAHHARTCREGGVGGDAAAPAPPRSRRAAAPSCAPTPLPPWANGPAGPRPALSAATRPRRRASTQPGGWRRRTASTGRRLAPSRAPSA